MEKPRVTPTCRTCKHFSPNVCARLDKKSKGRDRFGTGSCWADHWVNDLEPMMVTRRVARSSVLVEDWHTCSMHSDKMDTKPRD